MTSAKEHFIESLAGQHIAALERFLSRKLGNPEDAKDVAQDTFLRLQRLDAPQELENPKSYLFQIAANLAIDKLRNRSLQFRYLKTETELANELANAPHNDSITPEQVLAAQEQLQAIYDAVDELPPKVKQAFLLQRQRGLSYQDIATELGVSVSSIEKYILQALKHCRKKLAVYYPSD